MVNGTFRQTEIYRIKTWLSKPSDYYQTRMIYLFLPVLSHFIKIVRGHLLRLVYYEFDLFSRLNIALIFNFRKALAKGHLIKNPICKMMQEGFFLRF